MPERDLPKSEGQLRYEALPSPVMSYLAVVKLTRNPQLSEESKALLRERQANILQALKPQEKDALTEYLIWKQDQKKKVEIKSYTEEQERKLTQFNLASETVKFFHAREDFLNQGHTYPMVNRKSGQQTEFDQSMYWMVQGVSGKLFNQLHKLGMGEEVKEIMKRPPSIPEINNAPDLSGFRFEE